MIISDEKVFRIKEFVIEEGQAVLTELQEDIEEEYPGAGIIARDFIIEFVTSFGIGPNDSDITVQRLLDLVVNGTLYFDNDVNKFYLPLEEREYYFLQYDEPLNLLLNAIVQITIIIHRSFPSFQEQPSNKQLMSDIKRLSESVGEKLIGVRNTE